MYHIKTRYGYKVYSKGRLSIFGLKSPEFKMLFMGLIVFDSEEGYIFKPVSGAWFDHKFMKYVSEILDKLNLQNEVENEESF